MPRDVYTKMLLAGLCATVLVKAAGHRRDVRPVSGWLVVRMTANLFCISSAHGSAQRD